MVFVAVALLLPGAAAAQDSEPAEEPELAAEDPELDVSESEGAIVELQSGEEVIADQVIVKFKEEANRAAKEEARSDESLEKKEDLDLIDAEVDKVEGQSVEDVISALEARPEVEYAEPDHVVKPEGYSDERRFGELWGLHNTGQLINGSTGTADVDINAPEASAITQGGKNLVIAVIDDGVDFSHPELKDRAWKNPDEEMNGKDDDENGLTDDVNGWDFHNQDKTVHDASDYHGTHVSGTIAASANGEGIVGVAPNVQIMALKFIGPRGGATSNAIRAIQYAVDPNKDGDKSDGAQISNNSWGCGGTGCYNQALKDAIDASGMLFVASAGNSGVNNDTSSSAGYPASYNSPNILSVAAVDNRGSLAGFSNYGATSVDIAAPGTSVLSSIPDRGDLPSVTLSSIGSAGKAVTAGFGAEEIGDTAKQASFMKKAFDAAGRGSQQVVLVDDDASDAPSPTFNFPNVRPELRTAIQSTTGTTPTVINVPYGFNGPSLSQLQGKTVVWSTGQAWLSNFDSATGGIARTLTPTDRRTLTDFLNSGGKLVLTGMDALYLNENDSFVTGTLGLKAQSDINRLRAFNGSSGTAFAGESYDLSSSTADSNLHDVLTPASSTAIQEGVYPGRGSWDFLNGTSMAAPHATGAAALAASVNPAILNDPMALKKALMEGGKPASATEGKTMTGDMVDARAALGRADATKPQLSLPSDITVEATGASGAKVSYTATANDEVDGTVDVTCTPASDTTFPLGTTAVNCEATDAAGNKVTGSFKVTVQDKTAPELTVPSSPLTSKATSANGAVVDYLGQVSAQDVVDPDPAVECAPASGGTFQIGTTRVSCTARDATGNTSAAKTFEVMVVYDFKGFFSPVDNADSGKMNQLKASSSIPLKFSLDGDPVANSNTNYGTDVLTSQGSALVRTTKINCSSGEADPIPTTELVSAGASSLSYDPDADQYKLVWKTDKVWAGTCRQAVLVTKDGMAHKANFYFTK